MRQITIAVAVFTITLTARTALAGEKTCTTWESHPTHRAFDVRYCHEVDGKGNPFWFTLEYRNRYDRPIDATGDVFWADGTKEHFWATLKAGEERGAVCTQCRKKHPLKAVRWEITRLELK